MDFGAHLLHLKNVSFTEMRCPYCANLAPSPDGKEAICNFCESYINASEEVPKMDHDAVAALAEMQVLTRSGLWDDAARIVDALSADTSDVRVLYVAATFYSYLSDRFYYDKDYGLEGFMEKNAVNARKGIEIASKGKACLYKAIMVIEKELGLGVVVHPDLFYIEFMAYIKLGRAVDAWSVLFSMLSMKREDLGARYMQLVYDVESGAKMAPQELDAMLRRGEICAFYRGAAWLAKNGKPAEARQMLETVMKDRGMPFAVPLLMSIKEEEAHYA